MRFALILALFLTAGFLLSACEPDPVTVGSTSGMTSKPAQGLKFTAYSQRGKQ